MAIGDKPKYDIASILIYASLVAIGLLSIYSAAPVLEYTSLLDMNEVYGKQFLFIGVCALLIILILSVEVKFYERFAGLIYVVSLVSLAGLYFFGKEVNGALSWYPLGPFTFQPSEFAKFATALAVAKFLSQLNVSLKNVRDFMIAAGIIALPALLIIPQPDPGSALIEFRTYSNRFVSRCFDHPYLVDLVDYYSRYCFIIFAFAKAETPQTPS
jgi:rod shape determining protein RodA